MGNATDLIEAKSLADSVELGLQTPQDTGAEDPRVTESLDRLRQFKFASPRTDWAEQVREDEQFRNGVQWTDDQVSKLEARGQAPIVINRIHPAVDTAVSMLTANNPQFRCTAEEDSDRADAKLRNDLLGYSMHYNRFRSLSKRFINSFLEKSMGVLEIDQDFREGGDGEIILRYTYPLDLVIAPTCTDPNVADATDLFVERTYTEDRLFYMYPQYANTIRAAADAGPDEYPSTNRSAQEKQVFPGDINYTEQKRKHLVKRFTKIKQLFFRTYENFTNKERIIHSEDLEGYLKTSAVVLLGEQLGRRIAAEEHMVPFLKIIEEFGVDGLAKAVLFPPNPETGEEIPPQPYSPEMETNYPEGHIIVTLKLVDYKYLVDSKDITVSQYYETRIRKYVMVGRLMMYTEVLPTTEYPIIVAMNRHTDTPYPLSDVRMAKGMQEFRNTMTRLLISHTQSSAGSKVMLPKGSVESAEDLEERWARPNAIIEYEPEFGEPHIATPQQLSGEAIAENSRMDSNIEYLFGVFPLMGGDPTGAPRTVGGTLSIDEFGQRRLRSKLQDIEDAYMMMGRVMLDYVPYTFKAHRVLRIAQPDGTERKTEINVPMMDSFTNRELKTVNDVTDTTSRYDVLVVAGSTLPSNRWAEMEYYKEFYKMGAIDRIELLKKSEVFDAEGVINRISEIGKLQRALQEMQKKIKDLEGDLQTAHRESLHDRKRLELEKFKTELITEEGNIKVASELYQERLKDLMAAERRAATQSVVKPGGSPGQSRSERLTPGI